MHGGPDSLGSRPVMLTKPCTHLITERRNVPGFVLPNISLQVVGRWVMLTFIRILIPLWHTAQQQRGTQVRNFPGAAVAAQDSTQQPRHWGCEARQAALDPTKGSQLEAGHSQQEAPAMTHKHSTLSSQRFRHSCSPLLVAVESR